MPLRLLSWFKTPVGHLESDHHYTGGPKDHRNTRIVQSWVSGTPLVSVLGLFSQNKRITKEASAACTIVADILQVVPSDPSHTGTASF